MEILLIDRYDFEPFRAISENMDATKRLLPHVVEAQRADLLQMTGEDLYFDLINNVEPYLTAWRESLEQWESDYIEARRLNPQAVKPDKPERPIPTPQQKPFVDLLIGTEYNHKGRVKTFPGLVPVLVYLTYKRFVSRDNIRSTPSGFVIKTNMESTPVSAKQIAEEAGRAEADAALFYSYAVRYMKASEPFFKTYYNTCGCSDQGGGRFSKTHLYSPRGGRRRDRYSDCGRRDRYRNG